MSFCGFRSNYACDFSQKAEDSQAVGRFSCACMVNFLQEYEEENTSQST